MAQPWCTGPVDVWVKAPLDAGALFLGYGEQGPDIDLHPEYEDVYCDVGGTKVPLDKLDENEWGIGSVTLTYWNEVTLQIIQARPRCQVGTPPLSLLGARLKGEIGTLLLTEGYAYSVYYRFPYATKPAMATMPLGYRFPGSILAGPDRRKTGTRANKVGLTFLHLPYYNRITGAFLLYDGDMTGTGLPNLTADKGPSLSDLERLAS